MIDRLAVYKERGGENSLTLSYSYYVSNRKLKTLLENVNGHLRGASYIYDEDERLTSYQKANGKRAYTYDDFDRTASWVTSHKNSEDAFDTVLTTAFTFASSALSTTSGRVETVRQTATGYEVVYTYTYDGNGNILSVSDGTNTTTYEYDSADQLIRENNQAGNFTHVWTYDNAGNILSRTEYAYTTESLEGVTPTDTVLYTYGDEEWGDLLTAYDGVNISYDGIGNPLSDGTWNYTWEHGRQLASMTDGETTWTYTYNTDGLRTKRTDGTNTYEYVYYGGLLQYMEYNNTPVYFTHAPDGTPMGMLTGGRAYFYITNLQGDVTGIVDQTGNLVVSYTYDAWGNPLSTTLADGNAYAATVAALNPLRYRGYVYDADTGLYYVSSRYYDPETGRFLNSDILVSTGQGMLGYNMFAYCRNNPVRRVDVTGMADLDCYDEDGDDTNPGELKDAGGPSAPNPGPTTTNNGSSGPGSNPSNSNPQPHIPTYARDTLNSVKQNNGTAPPGFKGGQYKNDKTGDGSLS